MEEELYQLGVFPKELDQGHLDRFVERLYHGLDITATGKLEISRLNLVGPFLICPLDINGGIHGVSINYEYFAEEGNIEFRNYTPKSLTLSLGIDEEFDIDENPDFDPEMEVKIIYRRSFTPRVTKRRPSLQVVK